MHSLGSFFLSYGVGGALSAVVGIVVGIGWRRMRKVLQAWQADLHRGQQQITHLVQTAVDQSKHAVTSVAAVGKSATEAADSSREANTAIIYLAEEIGKLREQNDMMARRNDDMLAANLKYRAVLKEHGVTEPVGINPLGVNTGETAAQVTGRHRFPTQVVATVTSGGDV